MDIPQLKNTWTEINNLTNKFNNKWKTAKERIGGLKDESKEIARLKYSL